VPRAPSIKSHEIRVGSEVKLVVTAEKVQPTDLFSFVELTLIHPSIIKKFSNSSAILRLVNPKIIRDRSHSLQVLFQTQ